MMLLGYTCSRLLSFSVISVEIFNGCLHTPFVLAAACKLLHTGRLDHDLNWRIFQTQCTECLWVDFILLHTINSALHLIGYFLSCIYI